MNWRRGGARMRRLEGLQSSALIVSRATLIPIDRVYLMPRSEFDFWLSLAIEGR